MKNCFLKIYSIKNSVYFLGLIILLIWLVFFIWRTGINLTFNLSDIPFHLATSAGFARAGGIVTWDFWESLPLGRAHNYPPLFHIFFANFLRFGLSPVNTAKLMMEFTIVGGFLAYIWGISKLFNIKIAFWSVFFTFSSLYFIRLSATVMPATLTLFLLPALFYALRQKKWISYAIILIFMFYLHLFLPYVILFGLLIYIILCERELFRSWLTVTAIAFLCYSPWFIHVLFGGFEYIKYFDNSYSIQESIKSLNINIAIYLLLAISWIFFIKKKKQRTEPEKFIWIMIFIFLLMSFLSLNRIFNGNLLLLSSVPAAMAVIELRKNNTFKVAVLLLALVCGYNTFYVEIKSGMPRASIKKSAFLSEIYTGNMSYFSQSDYGDINTIIGKETRAGDSVIAMVPLYQDSETNKFSQMSIANYWAVPNQLSTLNLRQPEIYHRPPLAVAGAKVLITSTMLSDIDANLLRQYGYDESDEALSRIHNNFAPLTYSQSTSGETIYFYLNKSSETIKESISKARVSLLLADIIMIFLFLILLRDLKKPAKT